MTNRLICLHGLPRCGKDTLADQLVEHKGFTKLALSDRLYEEVATAYGVPVEALRSDLWKTTARTELRPMNCADKDFPKVCAVNGIFRDEPISSRVVLQTWGTEYRRRLHGDDYWTSQLIGTVRNLRGRDIVISDVRENHEAVMAYWMLRKGWFSSLSILEVTRPSVIRTKHSSDKGISRFLVDGVVHNDGSVDELYVNAVLALQNGREGFRHE